VLDFYIKPIVVLIVLCSFSVLQARAESDIEKYHTFLGFKLEESTIYDVINALGEAAVNRTGDAGSSYSGVCYQNANTGTTVYFESGEVGGSDMRLLSFQVHAAPILDYPCGLLGPVNMSKKLSIGSLKLGAEVNKVLSSLPKNTYERKALTFSYLTKVPFTEEQKEKFGLPRSDSAFWNRFFQIKLYAKNTKVSGYRVSQVTSW